MSGIDGVVTWLARLRGEDERIRARGAEAGVTRARELGAPAQRNGDTVAFIPRRVQTVKSVADAVAKGMGDQFDRSKR